MMVNLDLIVRTLFLAQFFQLINSEFFEPSFLKKNMSITEKSANEAQHHIVKRVVDGDMTYPGQWPWLAIISHTISYKKNLTIDTINSQCLGNLISEKHIITVAHCVVKYGRTVPANRVSVSLGKYNFDDPFEPGSITMQISEIKTRLDPRMSAIIDFDLALLFLQTPVQFTSNIQPIPLWRNLDDIETLVGQKGFVVGWAGRKKSHYKYGPRMITASIVSQDVCNFKRTAYKYSFCAGDRNGKGPCDGDSGSGFVIYDSETKKYYLRGLASAVQRNAEPYSCNLYKYAIYVDIVRHYSWMIMQLYNYS